MVEEVKGQANPQQKLEEDSEIIKNSLASLN